MSHGNFKTFLYLESVFSALTEHFNVRGRPSDILGFTDLGSRVPSVLGYLMPLVNSPLDSHLVAHAICLPHQKYSEEADGRRGIWT